MEILSAFAVRRGVTFPLLADPASQVIRAFGLFNEETPPDSRGYGMAHPGILLVDERGVVRERFFEEKYYHRMTTPTVLTQLGAAFAVEHAVIEGRHVEARAVAPQRALHPGNRVTLTIEILPHPGVHVYAPDVGRGYQGLACGVEPQPYFSADPPRYPPAAPLRLPWMEETLSGYTGPTRVDVDISLGTRQELAALLEAGEGLTVEGAVTLQACSDSVCWPPRTIRLAWQFDLIQPDLERVPEPFQHKPGA